MLPLLNEESRVENYDKYNYIKGTDHTVKYYSAIKKKIMLPAATLMNLDIIILSEQVRQRKTNIISYLLYMRNLKNR